MTIHKEIILRYRAAGHLRFAVPETLCPNPSVAAVVEQALKSIDGVYRVKLYRRQRKLSIRYFDTASDAPHVAREMMRILDELMREGLFAAAGTRNQPQHSRRFGRIPGVRQLLESRMGRWARGKYQEGKETLDALKVLSRRATGKKNAPALLQHPERSLMEFANDVLVLYLVKTHWQRILREWLPNPWRYRYQWLTVVYLSYLWVRWRHKA